MFLIPSFFSWIDYLVVGDGVGKSLTSTVIETVGNRAGFLAKDFEFVNYIKDIIHAFFRYGGAFLLNFSFTLICYKINIRIVRKLKIRERVGMVKDE